MDAKMNVCSDMVFPMQTEAGVVLLTIPTYSRSANGKGVF